jgi:hypothetical protein
MARTKKPTQKTVIEPSQNQSNHIEMNLGACIYVHGLTGGVVTVRCVADGLEVIRHSRMHDVIFLTHNA